MGRGGLHRSSTAWAARTFFVELVDRFYDGVAARPRKLLRLLYPDDLTESRRHLALFLAQYWRRSAGRTSEERGHPRACACRHAPFVIDDDARERVAHPHDVRASRR